MAATKVMKALKLSKAGNAPPTLAIEEVPVPTPKAGELLIKVYASAIQPADVLNYQGKFPHTTFPRIIGKDFAGVVVGGSKKWEGQEVFGTSGDDFSFTVDGAQSEYTVVPENAVSKKPKNLSFAQAAVLGTPWSTAYVTLTRARFQKGESVLVLGGTGSVGSAVMQIAKFKGAKGLSVGRHGADVNSSTDPELSKAKQLTGGKGPNVVVDTVGDLSLTKAAISVLADAGRLSIISAPRTGDTHLPIDVFALYRRQHELIGCNTAAMPQSVLADLLSELAPGFEDGTLTAPADSELNVVDINGAADAYANKLKKAIIVFAK